MKRILVTGAAGRLGKRVVQDLIATDYKVIAVFEDPEGLQSLQPLGDGDRLRLISCDLSDADRTSRLAQLVNDINVLVHLAGIRPTDPKDHATCTRQVIISLNLIESIGPRIDHAVLGSSVSVYDVNEGTQVAENHPTYPRSYHGASQLACEKFWNLFSISSGKPVACLRFDEFSRAGGNADGHIHFKAETSRDSSNGGESEEDAFLGEASRTLLQTVKGGGNEIVNIYRRVSKNVP